MENRITLPIRVINSKIKQILSKKNTLYKVKQFRSLGIKSQLLGFQGFFFVRVRVRVSIGPRDKPGNSTWELFCGDLCVSPNEYVFSTYSTVFRGVCKLLGTLN